MPSHEVSRHADEKWLHFEPTTSLSEDAKGQFSLFCMRVEELVSNWQDLVGDQGIVHLTFSRDESNQTKVEDFHYNYHRLKGLYLDYRAFIASREPTEFGRVTNMVLNHFSQPTVRAEIAKLRTRWKADKAPLEEWHGLSRDTLVKIYFNAKLFHSDAEKILALTDIQKYLTETTIHAVLFLDIHVRLRLLRNLRLILLPVSKGFCQIPTTIYESGNA